MSPTLDSQRRLPLPDRREALGFEASYTADEFERLRRGFTPHAMEDRWWIKFEDGWLYFSNATSRACIFWLRLDPTPAGARVAESWVNRNPRQFGVPRLEDKLRMLRDVIDCRLLRTDPDRLTTADPDLEASSWRS